MELLLKGIAERKALTVRQISIICKVPKSTVQDCLRAEGNPRIDTLYKLAKGLNCQITDLIKLDNK